MKQLGLNLFHSLGGLAYLLGGFCTSTFWFVLGFRALLVNESGELPGTPVVWLLSAPLIYVAWLLWFLVHCVLEARMHQLWLWYRKPLRVNSVESFRSYMIYSATLLLYARMRFVYSLPLVHSLLPLPFFRHLVLRSYSLTDHLGSGSLILGLLYDPDRTFVGEHAVVGSGSSLIGHSLTVNSDGSCVLVTAPIVVGARAVIGGCATIQHGVTIGQDAIVEPNSSVLPMTTIGDGEVWGGVPARFLRMRTVDTPLAGRPAGSAGDRAQLLPDADEQLVRRIVASALHRPIHDIPSDLNARNCGAWDSLAQLEMSLLLQKHRGIQLSSQESFRLRSMDDLRAVVSGRRAGQVASIVSTSATTEMRVP